MDYIIDCPFKVTIYRLSVCILVTDFSFCWFLFFKKSREFPANADAKRRCTLQGKRDVRFVVIILNRLRAMFTFVFDFYPLILTFLGSLSFYSKTFWNYIKLILRKSELNIYNNRIKILLLCAPTGIYSVY